MPRHNSTQAVWGGEDNAECVCLCVGVHTQIPVALTERKWRQQNKLSALKAIISTKELALREKSFCVPRFVLSSYLHSLVNNTSCPYKPCLIHYKTPSTEGLTSHQSWHYLFNVNDSTLFVIKQIYYVCTTDKGFLGTGEDNSLF